MGRIGINYEDVEKAALYLQGQGRVPTVDAIREVLGTGSKSTITTHLKIWKSKQGDGQGKLPNELITLISSFWEHMQSQADQRVQTCQQAFDSQIKLLEENLLNTQRLFDERTREHKALSSNFAIQAQEKLALEQALSEAQQENHDQQLRLNERLEQVDQLKTENGRLHQLASHFQENLEHYQNAIQQQRMEQTLTIENQKVSFEQEIASLKQQLGILTNQCQVGEKTLAQSTKELEITSAQYLNLHNEYQHLMQQYNQQEKDLVIYQERNAQLNKTNELQNQYLERNTAMMEVFQAQAQRLKNKSKWKNSKLIPVKLKREPEVI